MSVGDVRTAPGEFERSVLAVETRRRRLAPGGLGLWISVAWLVLVVALALLASVLPLQDPYVIDAFSAKQSPSRDHLMGTDNLGRDMLSRTVFGARSTFVVAFSALGISLLVGGLVGLLAGYYRGAFESVALILTDTMLAFPGLVLLLTVLTFLGQSTRNVTLALALFVIPGFVRISRASTMQYSERLFVLAARTLGARSPRIIVREIVPNMAAPLIGISFLVLGILVIAEGGLSFLGLGVPPPSPTWGGMISAGLVDLESAPHIIFGPAIVLFVTVLAFNVLGEYVRGRLETKESRI